MKQRKWLQSKTVTLLYLYYLPQDNVFVEIFAKNFQNYFKERYAIKSTQTTCLTNNYVSKEDNIVKYRYLNIINKTI